MNLHRSTRALVALAAVALLAAGCGDDDDDTTDAAETTTSTTEETATTAELEVTAVDFAYEGLEDEIVAGTPITLTNASDTEVHEMVAFRLPDDEQRSSDELFQLSEAELGPLFAGPPAMVTLAPPGGAPQIAALGGGTLTEPGRYLLFCSIPTGADPEEYLAAAQASGGEQPDVAGGPPHFVQGMHATITVTP